MRWGFTAPQLLLAASLCCCWEKGGNFQTYLKAAEGLLGRCQCLEHSTGKPSKPRPFSDVFYVLTPLATPLIFSGSFARA